MTKEELVLYGKLHDEVYERASVFATLWDHDPNYWDCHEWEVTEHNIELLLVHYSCGDEDCVRVPVPLDIFVDNGLWKEFIKETKRIGREKAEREAKDREAKMRAQMEEEDRKEYERLKKKFKKEE